MTPTTVPQLIPVLSMHMILVRLKPFATPCALDRLSSPQHMASPPVECHAAIHQARMDMARRDFALVVRDLTAALATGVNDVERERMLLLRADARHFQNDFEAALRDADEAVDVARNQSPQAQFVRGRELYSLCRLAEANTAFESAEILMTSPTPKRYIESSGTSTADQQRRAAANVGRDPQSADSTCPERLDPQADSNGRSISFEWAADLQQWRALRDECRAVLAVMDTRLVPRSVLPFSQNLIQRQLALKSQRSLVLTVRNDTTEKLTFEFHKFSDGQFLDKCTFPHVIPSMETAIAGVHATGWMSGVSGMVVFALRDTHFVVFQFSCPYFGSFAAHASIVLRRSISPSSVPPSPKKAAAVANIGGGKFRASALHSGFAQAFAVTRENEVRLSWHDVAAILDFLPPQSLRKVSAVSKAYRTLVNRLPPVRFFGFTAAYPDYRCSTDFDSSPWTVRDSSTVCWRVQSEGTQVDERLVSFTDASEHCVFSLSYDMYARTLQTTVLFNSRRSPIVSIEESWLQPGKKASVRLAGHTLGHLTNEDRLKLKVELGSRSFVAMSLARRSDKNCDVYDRQGNLVAEVKVAQVSGRPSRKLSTLAELVLHPGCDALLAAVLTSYALARLV